MRLSGRTALVTGASRGLGKAIAGALAEEGAAVAIVSRDQDALQATADVIRCSGGRVETFRADVGDEAQVTHVRDEFEAAFGAQLHILVNNAGINVRKAVTDLTLAEWNRVMQTNVTSAFLMCRAFLPLMKGQGYGRIINLTSIMSHVALPGRTAYAASKTALLGFTRSLALEVASEHITVNGISPGVFATEMNIPITTNAELGSQFLSRIPVARWGDPRDIGRLAVYLCSEEASFVTGTDIVIDGGWTAQ